MERLEDVSAWYTPARVEHDEALGRATVTGGFHDYAERIVKVCDAFQLKTIIEVGCGAGWIPNVLPADITYVGGIDANEHMLAKARERCPYVLFIKSDIRHVGKLSLPPVDLVCAFGVLKHFHLDEWMDILAVALKLARYGLFTQHVLLDGRESADMPGCDENGVPRYHDIWVSRADLERAVIDAGSSILDVDTDFRWDGAMEAPEAMVLTERKSRG